MSHVSIVDGLSKISFEIPRDCMSKYLTECAEKSYWKSLEMFLLGGGGQYAKGDGGIATGKCDLNEISLCDVIRSDPKPSMFYKLIETLIEHGALVNTSFHHESPLTVAVNFEDHDLAVILLKKNAEPGGLLRSKFAGKNDNSHVHIAFKIGLMKGKYRLLNTFLKQKSFSILTFDYIAWNLLFITYLTTKLFNTICYLIFHLE